LLVSSRLSSDSRYRPTKRPTEQEKTDEASKEAGGKVLNGDPNNRNNHVKTFSLVLETPHPVLLVIPVGAAGAVHSASANAGVLIARAARGEFAADAGGGGGNGRGGVLGGRGSSGGGGGTSRDRSG